MRAKLLVLPACLIASSCSLTGNQSVQTLQSLPAATYRLEKPHASLLVRMKHMGLSWYTVRFTDFDATLEFDPQNPAASHVKAIVNPKSVRGEHPTDTGWDKRMGEDLLAGT
jgi:polyisoprenoid-binding protein YceI